MWHVHQAVAAAIAVTVAIGAAGCTGFFEGDEPATSVEIDAARRFDERATYWLGDRFHGLPLYDLGPSAGGEAYFDYGTCTPSGNEGGCTRPLSLQEYPTCARSLWLYARFGKAGATTRAEGLRNLARMRRNLITVRGVPALVEVDRIEIYTGVSTIVVWAGKTLRFAAAGALRGFNAAAGGLASDEPLPAPAPGTFAPRKVCITSVPG